MKYIKLFEQFRSDWKLIDKGSEGDIYFDGIFIYKLINSDLIPPIIKIKTHIGKNYKNVVHILDVWEENDYQTIIKMENLDKIDTTKFKQKELDDMFNKLWHTEDEVDKLPEVIDAVKNPELKKMVQAMYNAGLELGKKTLDVGLHNLMYDPKTKEYKQVDFF